MNSWTAADASVAARAPHAIAHMNADHADALVDLCVRIGGVTGATAVTMTGLDVWGCDLEAVTGQGRQEVRILFDTPLRSGNDIRPVLVELTRRARLAR